MTSRFDEDLTRWERDEISLAELAARHPQEDVFGIAALYARLATAGRERTPDWEDGWAAVRERLPDPTPGALHRVGRWTTRPVMVAAVVTLLTAGLALAIEPVRRGVSWFFTEAAEVLAQSGIPNPISELLAPPRAASLQVRGFEDQALGWIPSVGDADGSRLTCDVVGGPAHGRAHVSPDCSEGIYMPDPNFHGSDSFTYVASDGSRLSDPAVVEVVLRPINDPPVAVDDAEVTDEDTAILVDVVGNDHDVDHESLSPDRVDLAEAASPPDGALAIGAVVGAEGKVTVAGDGLDLVYNPPPDFNGTDVFRYTVVDGHGGSDSATVTVTVRPINDPPVAEGVSITGDEDTSISWVPAATDVDGDAMTCSIVDLPDHGEATVQADCTGGTYEPEPDYHGDDALSFTVNDGSVSVSASVRISVDQVNDAPVAEGVSATGDEDAVTGWIPVTSDVDGDKLTCSIVDPPAHGQAAVAADCSGGTYTPEPNYHGDDAFTYTVTDGTEQADPATVGVAIRPVNDPPVPGPDFASTIQEQPVTIHVLSNDVDPDGDLLTVQSIGPPGAGSVSLNADGTLTYVPQAGFSGLDRFTYSVADPGGAIGTATVTVAVAPPPPPSFVEDPRPPTRKTILLERTAPS